MRKFQIGLLLFSLLNNTNCIVNKVTYNNNEEAFIRLASVFKNDTVSLNLNNSSIIRDEILNSKVNGITDNYLRITEDSVIYYNRNSEIELGLTESYRNYIRIEITINHKPYFYVMYFKKGRYLFISKHTYYYNVYFNQFKNKPQLY